MKRLNLKQLEIFTDIRHTQCVVQDVRETLADAIYSNCPGIKAHDLAFKVYRSDENTEFTDEDCGLLMRYAETLLMPFAIDALRTVMNKENV